jgi:hypothetical protein
LAVAPLNLTPQLQAWHDAGLSCLLLEEPLRDWLAALPVGAEPQVSTARERSAVAGAQIVPANRPSANVADNQATVAHRTMPQSGEQTAQSQHDIRPERQINVASEKMTTTGDLAAPEAAIKPTTLGVHDLPEPWKRVLRKVGPAPIAWVYPELGQDLLLQADAGRGQALRGIIAGLQLKKGSSTFWPAALPASLSAPGDSPEKNHDDRVCNANNTGANSPASSCPSSRDLFRFGLEHLGVKFLVVLGPQALEGTDYAHLLLRPFSEQIADGRLILALPGFAEILSGQAKLESITLFLRAVFSRYLFD